MASRIDPLESFLKDPLKFFPKFNGSVNKKRIKREDSEKGEAFSLDLYLFSALDSLVQNLVMFDQDSEKIKGIVKRKKRVDFGGFSSNLMFARIGGELSSKLGANGGEGKIRSSDGGESLNASMAELVELVPQLAGEKKHFSVEDFLKITQTEGRQFFEQLDRDKDGRVNLEDLEIAMSKRRLPKRYARELLRCTRRHLFSKSIGWKQFLSLMEQKELAILRAYTTLCLSKSRTTQQNEIVVALRIAGVPENEDNTVALTHYLNADNGESTSYSHFRNFILLLPSEHIEGDSRNKWCEGASAVPVSQPAEPLALSVLKSALAGGIACSFSAFVMHPVDTIKVLLSSGGSPRV